MLHNPCRKALKMLLHQVPFRIVVFHPYSHGAYHWLPHSRNGQAALFHAVNFFRQIEQNRVDHDAFESDTAWIPIFTLPKWRAIGHKQPQRQSDLGSCQANAICLVHRLPHVLQQARKIPMTFSHFFSILLENRVSVSHYGSNHATKIQVHPSQAITCVPLSHVAIAYHPRGHRSHPTR